LAVVFSRPNLQLTHYLSNETRDSVKNMNRIRYGMLTSIPRRSNDQINFETNCKAIKAYMTYE
jgi:hypothetical protein